MLALKKTWQRIDLSYCRDDLLRDSPKNLPGVLDYRLQQAADSMYNTPPTFAWYVASLVFAWVKEQGGLSAMSAQNEQKSAYLYDFIDNSSFYKNTIAVTCARNRHSFHLSTISG